MTDRIIFYDTEFLDDGKTIDLISIGMVDYETGNEYYAVNVDCEFWRIRQHDWLWENVVPSLPTITKTTPNDGSISITELDRGNAAVKPKWVIANEVRDFITGNDGDFARPQLWANYGAYDHVALAWLFGPMCDLPKGIPMWTHDLQQLIEPMGVKPPMQPSGKHNALEDARHNQRVYRWAMEKLQ